MIVSQDSSFQQILSYFTTPNAFRAVLILIVSFLAAYFLSSIIAKAIIRIAQRVSVRSDTTTDENEAIRLRQVETYLSVTIAIVRTFVVLIVGYITWQLLSPTAANNSGIAAIGAGAFFVVFAGQTLGTLLRDITAGAVMIIEKWFNVGDYIRVEPFPDVGGVVERLTLRSTKLRSINGEVIWLHNQHIMAVKVTPKGVRRIAVDIFANDEHHGEDIINKALDALPTGTLKVISRPVIATKEQWGETIWHFVVVAETAPGREWLIDKYFVESLDELDKRLYPDEKTFVRPHIARFADERAEQSFKRAVRVRRTETKQR